MGGGRFQLKARLSSSAHRRRVYHQAVSAETRAFDLNRAASLDAALLQL